MVVLKVFSLLCLIYTTHGFQCRDENNNEVDWYVLYKIPHIKKSTDENLTNGYAYAYITSDTINDDWKLSTKSVNSTDSIPGLTLKPLYTKSNASYILYNDQPPNGQESGRGHTKGLLVSNDTHGFWLIHSTPHFPDTFKEYSYPFSGTVYGQSFLCISFNIDGINLVSQQLVYNEPHIYLRWVSRTVAQAAPFMGNLTNDNVLTKPPWFRVANLTSINNQKFLSFAKSKNFNQDLYVDLVAPFFHSSMYAETWQNGAGKMTSNCSTQFEVDNILDISFKTFNINFPSTLDHSKWAVTYRKDLKDSILAVCIGDINRADHQKLRGGGTVCIQDNRLWKYYLNIAGTIEMCKKKLHKYYRYTVVDIENNEIN